MNNFHVAACSLFAVMWLFVHLFTCTPFISHIADGSVAPRARARRHIRRRSDSPVEVSFAEVVTFATVSKVQHQPIPTNPSPAHPAATTTSTDAINYSTASASDPTAKNAMMQPSVSILVNTLNNEPLQQNLAALSSGTANASEAKDPQRSNIFMRLSMRNRRHGGATDKRRSSFGHVFLGNLFGKPE